MTRVLGTDPDVSLVEVGVDTVYIRKNIIPINTENFRGWEYDEEVLTKDSFIATLQQENELLKVEQKQTSTTLLELMEVVLIGGM